MRKFVSWLSIVCLIPFLSGCEGFGDYTLTGRLWDSSAPDQHAPSTNPNLRVYQDISRKDLLVQYDEARDGGVRHRAYYLNANEIRVTEGRKPHFVDVAKSHQLAAVAVSTNGVVQTNGNEDLRVIMQPDNRHFVVMSSGHELAQYSLPVYPDRFGPWGKAALTPLTVTGDVLIYSSVAAAVIGVAALVAYAKSGTTINL